MKRFSKITTTQLARICGVSQGTVDRALHGREGISEKTKARILETAREYDYIPGIKGHGENNSMLIGVVLFDLYNEYFSKLAMSIVNAAKASGYSVIFQFSVKDIRSERAALEYFDYIGVDGIILFSVGSDSEEYANYLRSLKKPLVIIGNRMLDLPFIGIDDTAAMRELTEKYAAHVPDGDIIYYAPVLKERLNASNAQVLRLQGFKEAMAALGRGYRIATVESELTDFGGIVCATDYYAMKALKHLGYPEGITVAGFDNVSFLRNITSSVLTVEYSTDKVAKECLNYILGRRFSSKIEHRIVSNN